MSNWHFDDDAPIPQVVEKLCLRCLRRYLAAPRMALADLCDKCHAKMEAYLFKGINE